MENELPNTWASVPFDNLILFALGGDWGKAPDYDDSGFVEIRCIRASEIRNWAIDKGATAARRKVKKTSLEKRKLRENDIIVEISGGGPEQPVGRTVLIDRSVLSRNRLTPKICTNFFRLIRSASEIDSNYLNTYLQFFYRTGKISDYQGGSNNLRNLKFNDYLTISIPIPPTNEQRRLITKIEELFSELDKGIESLKTARKQLSVYRQALLKHAFEGKLTEQWRDENKEKLETAEEILARIKHEREARYQQQLEQWKTAVESWEASSQLGKKPAKPKLPNSLTPITEKEAAKLEILPHGWAYTRTGEVIDQPKYGTSKKCNYDVDGRGVLRIPNVAHGIVDATDLKFAQFDSSELETYRLKRGDILTIRSNGSISLVGKCALISEAEEQFLYAGYLIRLRPIAEAINSDYLISVLSSHYLRTQIEQAAKSTSGVNNINSGEIQNLIVPVCSVSEQQELMVHLESILSLIYTTENEIDGQLSRSESLRQSILKKAFFGQLVEQDPNDEPASVLLERIKSEKLAQSKPNKKSKKGKRAA